MIVVRLVRFAYNLLLSLKLSIVAVAKLNQIKINLTVDGDQN